jgi:hypothetical protein
MWLSGYISSRVSPIHEAAVCLRFKSFVKNENGCEWKRRCANTLRVGHSRADAASGAVRRVNGEFIFQLQFGRYHLYLIWVHEFHE